jgi:hypothetical protein
VKELEDRYEAMLDEAKDKEAWKSTALRAESALVASEKKLRALETTNQDISTKVMVESGIIENHDGHSHGVVYDYVTIQGKSFLIVSMRQGGVSVIQVKDTP